MNDLILSQIENSLLSNLRTKNEKNLSGQRNEGSTDSIDTFASCFTSFTHPFNSLADLDEDQFKPDANSRKNKDDLKENKSLIRNQSRIGDLRLSVCQLKENKKRSDER